MSSVKIWFLVSAFVAIVAVTLYANTPGKHSVTLTWIETPACPTCTYNIYRGSATGVCVGTVTPLATGITSTTYTDTAVTAATTYFYNVSAVNGGVESACAGPADIQIAVPSPPNSPSALQGTAQ
jgi:hypothetical protein